LFNVHIKGKNMIQHFYVTVVLLLLAWISFVPVTIQQGLNVFFNITLVGVFFVILAHKRKSMFQFDDLPLWLFITAISVNILFAQYKSIAFTVWLNIVIPMIVIYYLIAKGFFTEKNFSILLKAICISSILVSLYGLYEIIFAFNHIHEYFIKNYFYIGYSIGAARPVSTQFHPAILGGYLLAASPFCAILFKRNDKFFKILGAIGLILNVTIALSVRSRGVFLGLLAAFACYSILQKRYFILAVFVIVVLISMTICSYGPYPMNKFGFKEMLFGPSAIFSEYRFIRGAMTKQMLIDHPFVGLGFCHFRINFYNYCPLRYRPLPEFTIADNMYLTILAETGLIGFIGFFILIFSIFTKIKQSLKRLKNCGQQRRELIFMVSGFVSLLIHMMSYELFYWSNMYIFFCMFISLLKIYMRPKCILAD